MKLCYIWVEKFKNFDSFEINLSNKNKFSFNPESNTINRIELDDLPKGFFPPTFHSITGVIGKNGVGKSTALELICNVLKGAKNFLNSDFFMIMEEAGLKTDRPVLKAYYYFGNRATPKARGVIFLPHPGNFEAIDVVFFSNVFDNRRNNFHKDVVDLSANARSGSHYRLSNLTSKDFRDQISLISSEHYEDLNIETPKSIHISGTLWSEIGSGSAREMVRFGITEIIEFRRFVRKRMKNLKNKTNLLYLMLKFVFFFETISKYLRNYQVGEISDGPFADLSDVLTLDANEPTEVLAQRLVEYVSIKFKDSESGFGNNREIFEHPTLTDSQLVENQMKFLTSLKLGEDLVGLDNYFEGPKGRPQDNFIFEYSGEASKQFVDGLSQTMTYFDGLSVNWLGISSGQRAYLNLFASLYNAIKNFTPGNLVLCIDEGDLYLHPKWQIEFFSKLTKVLPAIYSGEIQLILTSHSPFLLSDLPRQNIEILNSGKSYFSDAANHAATFGGNLYDLYAGPLFLGTDRTGLFAKNKIEEFLRLANKDKKSRIDEIYIDRFLKILGDDILKFKIERERKKND